MWFKNLRLYRFTETFDLSPEALDELLAAKHFQPCGSLDPVRYGWVSPLGRHGTQYVHAANGYIMVCMKRQEKILPAAVINEALEEKVFQLTEEEGRPVGRKERQSMKDEIAFSLMPNAFTKSSLNYAYIAPQDGLLVVNASSAKRAEDLLAALRDAIGSLKVIPVTTQKAPTQIMTHWVNTLDVPKEFEIGDECEFKATTDGRVIRCKNADLTADEIRQHLETGMFVKRLSVTWNEAIHCVVDEDFGIKRLKFEDSIQSKAESIDADSAAAQFDAEFSVMTVELAAFISSLLAAFGGTDDSL
jgi:recombination associated protein RdgC